jgi:hypothetical protein
VANVVPAEILNAGALEGASPSLRIGTRKRLPGVRKLRKKCGLTRQVRMFRRRCLILAPRCTGFVPSILESGRLQLSTDEVSTYRAAADRLHEACETALDLTQPITIEDWVAIAHQSRFFTKTSPKFRVHFYQRSSRLARSD